MDLPFETMATNAIEECIDRISFKSSDCQIISIYGWDTVGKKIAEGRDLSGKFLLVQVFSGTEEVNLLGNPEKSPWIGKKEKWKFSVLDLKMLRKQNIKPLNADEDASTNGSPMLKTKHFCRPGNFKDLNRDESIFFLLERRKYWQGSIDIMAREERQEQIMDEHSLLQSIEEWKDRISVDAQRLQNISIYGMPGLGKTTFAQKVYQRFPSEGGFGKTTLARIGEGGDWCRKLQLVQVFSGTGRVVSILVEDPEKSPWVEKKAMEFSVPDLKTHPEKNIKPQNADEDASSNGSPMVKTDFYLPGNFKDLNRDERILFLLERRKDLEGSDRVKEHIMDQHILLNRRKYLEGIADIMERLKYASRENWKRSEVIMGRMEGEKHIMDEHNILKSRKYLDEHEDVIEEWKDRISLHLQRYLSISINGMPGLGKTTFAQKVYQRFPGQGLDLCGKFLLELVVAGSDGIHVLPGDPENSPEIRKEEKWSFSAPALEMLPKQNIKPPLSGEVDGPFTNGSPMLKMKHFRQPGNFEDLNRLPSNMKFQNYFLLILATMVKMGTLVSESRFASTHSPLQDKRNSIAMRSFVVFNSVAFVTSLSGVIYLLHEFPLKPWSQISISMLFGSYMVLLFNISPYEALSLLLFSIPLLLFASSAILLGLIPKTTATVYPDNPVNEQEKL